MKKQLQNIQFRIPKEVHEKMLIDLKRPHDFAYERVGFLFAKTILLSPSQYLVIATDYKPVADDNYIDDPEVGAKINSTAIRNAMQETFDKRCGCFHVHLHDHNGKPYPSPTDEAGLPGIVDSFTNIASQHANGILILSKDAFYTAIKVGGSKNFLKSTSISIVGFPFLLQYGNNSLSKNAVFDRQSFLGPNSQNLIDNIKIGIIGYGGGGSHIGQQLAHIGFKHITIFDDDHIEDSNLNRLVGANYADIKKSTPKTVIASRIIKSILPSAKVTLVEKKWQDLPEALQSCDIILGCVDSYSERQQLEAECRRFLIPLIDIGMDVYYSEGYSMSGQVILSMPGSSCMSCYGFLTEAKLAKEAEKYGKVGGRPQVVWPNGVLASTAIGILVDIVTGWTGMNNQSVYLAYDGNSGKIENHIRKMHAPNCCEHYPITAVGQAQYNKI
ncbi:HesA/MoeB/ThiF family protein [Flavobacterium sp. UBA7682]|uniref:HesA/MoeB/ThiF family protein n=1 Tax=Flavobacterium sp. UBA7682 TaxID=1946560 RepID=UPI0025C04345|nr:ThiF family adenylyltransferase [Flavobacterium sp. UBA7682]